VINIAEFGKSLGHVGKTNTLSRGERQFDVLSISSILCKVILL
jgi:hypothetical protein